METGALIAASFSKQIWHLFLTQGVFFGIGMGFLFTGSVGVISQWFAKKRSVATGITAAGSGIGGLIFSLSIRHIITTMGTPWAFRIVAVAIFVNNSICTYFTRDRNKFVNPNQRAFDLAILRRYEFLLTVAWGFFSMLGYVVILFSLPGKLGPPTYPHSPSGYAEEVATDVPPPARFRNLPRLLKGPRLRIRGASKPFYGLRSPSRGFI